METSAIQIRRRSSLLPALLLAVSVVGAFELSSRLMNYVQEEFGTEAHQRLENWQRLHALATNAPSTGSFDWSTPSSTGLLSSAISAIGARKTTGQRQWNCSPRMAAIAKIFPSPNI